MSGPAGAAQALCVSARRPTKALSDVAFVCLDFPSVATPAATGSASPGSGAPRTPGNPERKRVRVLYSGHVQGVGFRYAARHVASGFDVCGTVRNLPDGRVELVAEGTRSELESFCREIGESGVGPLVRDQLVQWTEAQGNLRGFEILG